MILENILEMTEEAVEKGTKETLNYMDYGLLLEKAMTNENKKRWDVATKIALKSPLSVKSRDFAILIVKNIEYQKIDEAINLVQIVEENDNLDLEELKNTLSALFDFQMSNNVDRINWKIDLTVVLRETGIDPNYFQELFDVK